jgi:hypothetical protein
MAESRSVLLISENAPVPADRRVWNEARTLTAAGWAVTIVCAQGSDRDSAPFEVLEGIEIHRYPLRPSGGGPLGYLREYAQAMWRIRALVRRLARRRRFDVVHACNPPDFLLLAARSLRRRGTRFVFDRFFCFVRERVALGRLLARVHFVSLAPVTRPGGGRCLVGIPAGAGGWVRPRTAADWMRTRKARRLRGVRLPRFEPRSPSELGSGQRGTRSGSPPRRHSVRGCGAFESG